MKKAAAEKEVTLRDLSQMIQGVENAVDSLALSTAKGFAGVDEKFDAMGRRLAVVEEDISILKTDAFELKEGVQFLRHGILEIGDRYVGRSEFEHMLDGIPPSGAKLLNLNG